MIGRTAWHHSQDAEEVGVEQFFSFVDTGFFE